MAVSDVEFRRPEEAPTFYPTALEFQQPMVYIAKIRSQAEKYGICKIKPPPVTITPNILFSCYGTLCLFNTNINQVLSRCE